MQRPPRPTSSDIEVLDHPEPLEAPEEPSTARRSRLLTASVVVLVVVWLAMAVGHRVLSPTLGTGWTLAVVAMLAVATLALLVAHVRSPRRAWRGWRRRLDQQAEGRRAGVGES